MQLKLGLLIVVVIGLAAVIVGVTRRKRLAPEPTISEEPPRTTSPTSELESLVGQARVLEESGAFGIVQPIEHTPKGRFVQLANSSRTYHIPEDQLDLLREPVSTHEAAAWISALESSAPFTGETRRLQVRMALAGTKEQRFAAIGTALDWDAQRPPREELPAPQKDQDWRFASHILIPEIDGMFAELAYVLKIDVSGLALIKHFRDVRAAGARNVPVTPPEAPPQPVSTHALPQEMGARILTTMDLRGGLDVRAPYAANEPSEGVHVDTTAGSWTVASIVTPDPEFDDATWIALVRGTPDSIALEDRKSAAEPDLAGKQIRLDGGAAISLKSLGVAHTESGQLAFLASPPETAIRSMRFPPPAQICVWSWGVLFGTGGDGEYGVLVARDDAGVVAIVTMLAV